MGIQIPVLYSYVDGRVLYRVGFLRNPANTWLLDDSVGYLVNWYRLALDKPSDSSLDGDSGTGDSHRKALVRLDVRI